MEQPLSQEQINSLLRGENVNPTLTTATNYNWRMPNAPTNYGITNYAKNQQLLAPFKPLPTVNITPIAPYVPTITTNTTDQSGATGGAG
jgi:hypothetical protein